MHATHVKTNNKSMINNKPIAYKKYVILSQSPLELMKENSQRMLQVKVQNLKGEKPSV